LQWLLPESALLAFAVIVVALTSAATVATNQFHKWAHQEHVSRFARLLQRMRLVLEPTHHKLHHTEPFNMHYCITNGWLNPLLNKIKFFRRLEAILAFCGIKKANTSRL
jgi:ubiquitin-conjugating enzyme E2 variant